MKRNEIKNLNNKLQQIDEFEGILKEINGKGKDHWWEISIPDKNAQIIDEGSRSRFQNFIEKEIEILKKEISLED